MGKDGLVAALLLFVIGYLVVYMQGIRAHAQLETAHRELSAIHEELVAASSQIAVLTRLTERQRLARNLHDTLVRRTSSTTGLQKSQVALFPKDWPSSVGSGDYSSARSLSSFVRW